MVPCFFFWSKRLRISKINSGKEGKASKDGDIVSGRKISHVQVIVASSIGVQVAIAITLQVSVSLPVSILVAIIDD